MLGGGLATCCVFVNKTEFNVRFDPEIIKLS